MTSIAALENELLGIVKSVTSVGERGYSVYNLDEVGDIASKGSGFPLAAVAYIGTVPRENSVHPSGGAKQQAPAGMAYVLKQFAILIAVEYNWTTGEDTKPVATDLLDDVRGKLLGFSGVNARPWQLVDEGPANSNISGAILYMQTWQTSCIDKGNSA